MDTLERMIREISALNARVSELERRENTALQLSGGVVTGSVTFDGLFYAPNLRTSFGPPTVGLGEIYVDLSNVLKRAP